jgi:AbrB family looped-hinge helix DNA binding protein
MTSRMLNAILNGKMPFMGATAEMDKSGRVVVPKKIRDSLHLVPGTRISFRVQSGEVVIAPETPARGLYMDKGTLVYDAGSVPPSDVLEWIREDREARMGSFTVETQHS